MCCLPKKALLCTFCNLWCHYNCTTLSEAVFNSDIDWICDPCFLAELPYNKIQSERDESHNVTGMSHENYKNGSNVSLHNKEVEEKLKS